MESEQNPAPVLSSLDTGLRVLSMFGTREHVSITSVSQTLGISRSTAYRTLNTLRNRGFLTLGPNNRGYFPGPAIMEMARPTRLDMQARERLRPVIEDAVQRTGETVHVAALIGTQVILFDGKEAERTLRASSRIGYMRPAHAMSSGKLFLSRLIPEQIRALFPEENLPQYTANTTKTVTDLIRELKVLSEQNYVVTLQEIEPDLNGVSILLEGNTWRSRIALVSSVPAQRSDRASLTELKDQMLISARLLKRK